MKTEIEQLKEDLKAMTKERDRMREALMLCNTVGQQTHIQLRIDAILATQPTNTDNSKENVK